MNLFDKSPGLARIIVTPFDRLFRAINSRVKNVSEFSSYNFFVARNHKEIVEHNFPTPPTKDFDAAFKIALNSRVLGEVYDMGASATAEEKITLGLKHSEAYPEVIFEKESFEKEEAAEPRIKTEKKRYPQLSIVHIMRNHRLDEISRAMTFLVMFLLLSILLSLFKIVEWGAVQIALFISIVLFFIRQQVLDYRILNRLFGNNEREAREIIEFIVKESSNIDFRDGGKLKKILSDEDLQEIKQAATQHVPGFAGAGGIK